MRSSLRSCTNPSLKRCASNCCGSRLLRRCSQDATLELLGERRRACDPTSAEVGFLATDQPTTYTRWFATFCFRSLPRMRRTLVRNAVLTCIERERWDRAFELILRFELNDLVEPALEAAYKPLARRGHLGTLSTFARAARALFASSACPAIIDLVDAEVASRDGELRACNRSRDSSPIKSAVQDTSSQSRAHAIIGHCAFSQADLETAESAYGAATKRRSTTKMRQKRFTDGHSLRSRAKSETPEPILRRLAADADIRARLGSVWTPSRSLGRRFGRWTGRTRCDSRNQFMQLGILEDPRARSSLTFLTRLRIRLDESSTERLSSLAAHRAQADVDAFDLEFARPYSNSNLAFIYMGLRRFRRG